MRMTWSAYISYQRAPRVEVNAQRAGGLIKLFPELDRPVYRLPCACGPWFLHRDETEIPLYTAIVHLNDEHGTGQPPGEEDLWSRERIADWVDSVTQQKEN